jgi:hypothetical protein
MSSTILRWSTIGRLMSRSYGSSLEGQQAAQQSGDTCHGNSVREAAGVLLNGGYSPAPTGVVPSQLQPAIVHSISSI